jgi:hypothetical protein
MRAQAQNSGKFDALEQAGARGQLAGGGMGLLHQTRLPRLSVIVRRA